MSDQSVTCPKCHHQFAPTAAMEASIRSQLDKEFSAKEEALKDHEVEVIDKLKRELDVKLKSERAKIEANLTKAIKEESQTELTDLQEQLREQQDKLKEAQANELKFRQAKRELEDSKHELQLSMERKLDEERVRIKADIGNKLTDEHQLKQKEWDTQRESMEKMITALKQKAEQGSQQLQGEALELSIEETLRELFTHDSIEPVAKGVLGGDVLQRVSTRTGQVIGGILYEIKRTKNFSESWLPKLKDDQRAAKADLAVLITMALPEGVKTIGQIDGVWVCSYQAFPGLALALRASLVEVSLARNANVGKNEKLESMFQYLTGGEFRGRVEAVVEAFTSLKEDLESEKRAADKSFAKREKQLSRALVNTAGLYGELQGILGASIQEIPQLTTESK